MPEFLNATRHKMFVSGEVRLNEPYSRSVETDGKKTLVM